MRVYVDFKSPAAYLALKPTMQFAQRLGLALQWQAFNSTQPTDNEAVAEDKSAAEDKGAVHRRVRAKARRQTHLRYADVQGVNMSFRAKTGSTDLALMVLDRLAVADRQQFVVAAFEAYWCTSLDLNAPQQVASLLQKCGFAPELVAQVRLSGNASMEALNSAVQQADGVVDVPAYIVRGEIFIGREHLPWIESIYPGSKA